MALVVAPIMTAIAIVSYNALSLLMRHHHTAKHDIDHVVGALFVFGAFYAVIRYMQALPDEDE
jgi:apolipoprotein N-acyltransferase